VLASLCCREAESLGTQQKCKVPRDTSYQHVFVTGPDPGWGSTPGGAEKVRPNLPRAAISGEHREESTNCKREEFDGILRSSSACTWPSASL